MKRNYILFDLDGTLTDSSEGITNAVVYALEYYGIHEDKKHLKKFIGPPLRDSFQEYYGFSTQRAAEAVEKYREYYNAGGMFENQVYPGIPRLLHRLNGAGDSGALWAGLLLLRYTGGGPGRNQGKERRRNPLRIGEAGHHRYRRCGNGRGSEA